MYSIIQQKQAETTVYKFPKHNRQTMIISDKYCSLGRLLVAHLLANRRSQVWDGRDVASENSILETTTDCRLFWQDLVFLSQIHHVCV